MKLASNAEVCLPLSPSGRNKGVHCLCHTVPSSLSLFCFVQDPSPWGDGSPHLEWFFLPQLTEYKSSLQTCQGDIGKNHHTRKFYIFDVALCVPHLDHSGLFLEIYVWGREPGTASQLRNRDYTLSSDWLMPVKVYRQEWEGNHSLSSLSVWGWIVSWSWWLCSRAVSFGSQGCYWNPLCLSPALWTHNELVHSHPRHLSTTTDRKILYKQTGSTWHQGPLSRGNLSLNFEHGLITSFNSTSSWQHRESCLARA